MTDAIGTFFRDLVDRGPQPILSNINGTVRFDLAGGALGADEVWQLSIEQGAIQVPEGRVDADCTMRSDKEFFERLISGRENAMAAILRGEIECFGDVELLMAVQRIFPGPPDQSSRLQERGSVS